MKNNKKSISVLLIISILISIVPILQIKAASINDAVDTYLDGKNVIYIKSLEDRINKGQWTAVKDELQMPLEIQEKNISGFSINLELWLEQRITVYGDYKLVQPNDFEYGRQINDFYDSNAKGYYQNSKGEYGEFRYHGFTYEGNKYTNKHFKNDIDLKKSPEQKNWIYKPWENTTVSQVPSESDYNEEANGLMESPRRSTIRSWLKTNFKILKIIQNNTEIDYTIHKNTNPAQYPTDYWNYFNVETPPGLTNYGEVVGYHRTYSYVTQNGKTKLVQKDWYQTFTIDKAADKIQPDTSTDMEILDINYIDYDSNHKIEFLKENEEIDIILKVTSILKDSQYLSSTMDRTLYYNRYDIKRLYINVISNHFEEFDNNMLLPIKAEKTVDEHNNYKAVTYFSLKLPNDSTTKTLSELKFTAKSQFIYQGNDKTSPYTEDTDTAPIDRGIICDFNVNTNIQLEHGQAVTISDINYSDASKGQIDQYDYVIESLTPPRTSLPFTKYTTVKNEDINAAIKGVIDSSLTKLINPTKPVELKFKVFQEASNKAGKRSSKDKIISVTVNPITTAFYVAEKITVMQGSTFKHHDIYYSDKSIGRIKKYTYKIRNNQDGKTSLSYVITKNPNTPLSPVNIESVNTYIYNFINKYVEQVGPGVPKTTFDFTVEQTITSEANKDITAVRNIIVDVIYKANMYSFFTVNEVIQLEEGEALTVNQIGYKNASGGTIGKYEFIIQSENGDGASTAFVLNTMNEATVNNSIYNFVLPYLNDLDSEKFHTFRFGVHQTAINKFNSSDIDTCYQDFFISVGPGEIVIPPPPVYVKPQLNIPKHALDLLPMAAYDNTAIEEYISRTVSIDGIELSQYEAASLFSGSYIWGDHKDGLRNIKVQYISTDGYPAEYSCWVLVHDTKPQPQFKITGTYKENRALRLQNTSCYADAYVNQLANTPEYRSLLQIKTIGWNDYGSQSIRYRTNNSSLKELLYKEPGFYRYSLTAGNNLRTDTATYDISFQIMEDNKPAIALNIWNYMLIRNEKLQLTYTAESADGDSINIEKLDIYYDSNNDKTYEEHIGVFTPAQFEGFKASRLGNYKVVAFAKEAFGEETLAEFINDSDYKTITTVRNFTVDNLSPLTTMSVNLPMTLPKVDVLVLLDQSLTASNTTAITGNRINSNNYLRNHNLMPTYNIWDLHTYTYSTDVSTSYHTGTSYPANTISYSSGGYSGTLNRMSISDNGGHRDLGSWKSKVETKTFNGTHDTTYTYTGHTMPDTTTSTTVISPAPSIKSINEDGYSGNIPQSSTGTISDTGKITSGPATESRTFTATHTNTVNSNGLTNPWVMLNESHSSPAPSSKYINDSGYTGNIPRISTEDISDTGFVFSSQPDTGGRYSWTRSATFRAIYQGTLTKSIRQDWTQTKVIRTYYSGVLSKTVQYWEPNVQWIPDYTGYYSGTVYKSIKQPFTNPFSVDSKRYVIYVSDNIINNPSDLNTIINNNQTNLILVGSEAIKNQAVHSKYINNSSSDINSLINQALNWISEQNPLAIEGFTVLPGHSFTITCGNFDDEGDPIISEQFLYVHNASYYDNSQGQEAGTVPDYSNTTGWTETKKDAFYKPGAYTVFRRIKDQATTDPRFAEYNKESNEPYFRVNIHRRPIALADMKWRYDPATSLYKLTFIDKSYDLDHQYSRADKGIEESMIRYRKGSGDWNYKMPTDLSWGTYTIEYYVKDIEQAWSEPYILTVTLDSTPTANITIDSGIQFKETIFRNDSTIPAGETVQITASHKTGGVIIRSNIPVTSAEIYINGTKLGNLTLTQLESQIEFEYQANIMEYTIPSSYADGSLDVKIKASTSVNNQYAESSHIVQVYTPIWQDYSRGRLRAIDSPLAAIPYSMELCATTAFEKANTYSFVTSKYTQKVKIQIDGIVFYMLENGKLSKNEDGSGAADTISSLSGSSRYKANQASVIKNTYNKIWSFDIYVVEGYPIMDDREFDITITGYDGANLWNTTNRKHNTNPQTQKAKAECYLLERFRVVQVKETKLESYYYNISSGKYTDIPIYVNNMAVDGANFSGLSSLTKGYIFEFEIDSINFSENDVISIEPSFYTCDSFSRDAEKRDLYWEDSGNKILKAGAGGHSKYANIILKPVKRNGSKVTWRGSYLIPATAWAVPLGTTSEQAKSRNLKRDIIVSFHIKGYKNGELKFDYNERQWIKERTSAKYPYKLGDVIRYDWTKSCLDDKNVIRNR